MTNVLDEARLATGRGGSTAAEVRLLGGFQVACDGTDVAIPASTWRLVAFLALQSRPVERGFVAGSLWLEKSDSRAQANLRSALWRLRQCGIELVDVSGSQLRLAPLVGVDVTVAARLARLLIDDREEVDLDMVELDVLAEDLLPDWYDDFVQIERERLRQLRLHALEALARRLYRRRRFSEAIDTALAAVSAEPLRESAHRTVIEVHLSEGNVSEALRQYRSLARILESELGLQPSPQTRALISSNP